QPDTFRIKPRVITKEIFVKAGELYNQSSVTDTYKHLSAFNVFKMVEVNFDDHTMSKDFSIAISTSPRASRRNLFMVLEPLILQAISVRRSPILTETRISSTARRPSTSGT
ncbi:MAG: hypothetical protein IJ933_06235, partial [Bacteroidales bacterium]|nr:hypothetical protein [Bacteroidales bacterium]